MSAHDRTRPFNELPALPPPCEVETKEVLKACLQATRALAELKGVAHTLPDQSILINSIPLQEAKISSEIENIVTTQDKLFQADLMSESSLLRNEALDENKIDPATKEVLRYRMALRYGYEEMKTRPFNMRLIRDICSCLRGRSVSFRPYGNVVALSNPDTGERRYTPPQGGDILLDKLNDLDEYIAHYKSHDPLIRMALAHYQFETIHPFDDGNGRTGRIMNILFLINEGLLDLPVLYLSRYIIENKNEYYRLFCAVTEEKKWEAWVLYMLKAVAEMSLHTTQRIRQIGSLFEETRTLVKTKAPKIYSKELVEIIFRQAYCKVNFLVHYGLAKRQTASIYLQELVRLGILQEVKSGREKIYINTRLVEILRR